MPEIGGLPNAPAPASYNSPIIDFSPLGKLADSYFQGDMNRRKQALMSAFQTGVPTLPNGQIDYAAVSKTLARLGDPSMITGNMPKFQQTAEGFLGDKQFGWVDPLNRTVTPTTGAGGAAGAGGATGLASNRFIDQDTGEPIMGERLLTLLDRTDPVVAAGVRGLLTGDESAMGRNLQKLIPLARLVDPTFTMADYQTRLQTRKSFAPGGKDAVKVQSINQSLNHAAYAYELINKMPNTRYAPGFLNPIIHRGLDWTGNEDFQKTRTELVNAFNALGGELAKAFRGNQAALADVEHWRQGMNIADSPAALLGGIKSAMKLLGGAMDATADSYNRGMKTQREGVEFLDPANAEVYERLASGKGIDDLLAKRHEGGRAIKGVAPTATPALPGVPSMAAPGPQGGGAQAPGGPQQAAAALIAKAAAATAKHPDKAADIARALQADLAALGGGR